MKPLTNYDPLFLTNRRPVPPSTRGLEGQGSPTALWTDSRKPAYDWFIMPESYQKPSMDQSEGKKKNSNIQNIAISSIAT